MEGESSEIKDLTPNKKLEGTFYGRMQVMMAHRFAVSEN